MGAAKYRPDRGAFVLRRDQWSNQATELDSDEEEDELPDMSAVVSEETNDDDETFEDVDWE